MATPKPQPQKPVIHLNSERLDELEFRIRGIAAVLGYDIVECIATEYRHATDDDDDMRPRIRIEFVQNDVT